MPGTVPPAGLSGSCFLALAALGGQATSTEVRLYLKAGGKRLGAAQVRGGLYRLARQLQPPLAEVMQHGQAGYAQPNLWRLTDAGRAVLPAGESERDGRETCGTGWPQPGGKC